MLNAKLSINIYVYFDDILFRVTSHFDEILKYQSWMMCYINLNKQYLHFDQIFLVIILLFYKMLNLALIFIAILIKSFPCNPFTILLIAKSSINLYLHYDIILFGNSFTLLLNAKLSINLYVYFDDILFRVTNDLLMSFACLFGNLDEFCMPLWKFGWVLHASFVI